MLQWKEVWWGSGGGYDPVEASYFWPTPVPPRQFLFFDPSLFPYSPDVFPSLKSKGFTSPLFQPHSDALTHLPPSGGNLKGGGGRASSED